MCTNIEQVGLSEIFNRICWSKVYFFCAQISVFSVGSNVRYNLPRVSRSIERPSNLYIQGFVAMGVNYLCVSVQNSKCIAEFALSRVMHRIQSETLYGKNFLCASLIYLLQFFPYSTQSFKFQR